MKLLSQYCQDRNYFISADFANGNDTTIIWKIEDNKVKIIKNDNSNNIKSNS